MNPALLSVLVATLNWNALIPAQRTYSTFTNPQLDELQEALESEHLDDIYTLN